MKGIDPKYIMYLGLLVTVEQAIGHGTVSLTNLVPASWAPYITSWCNFLAFIGTSIMTYQAAISGPQTGPLVNLPSVTPTIVKVLIAAFVLSMFLPSGPANAQIHRPHVTGNLGADLKADANDLANQGRAAVTGQSGSDSTAPLACTFQMLTRLTPANLLPTINQCIATKLVADTQRALSSAEAYGTTGKGDADAVNCLTPALAIFQAGVEVPAVPAQEAVLNPDGSVKTPAVAAVPAQEPGPILLYQKYREFTLSGALTSCQSWFNGPINATVAAGLGAASTAIGGAALLAPLK